MGSPNWRPRYKYYHWSLSIFGSIICLSVMFIASPLFAVIAILLAILIYLYTHFKGYLAHQLATISMEWSLRIPILHLQS